MARDAIKEIMELKSRNEFADSHQFYLRLYSLQELLKNNSNKGHLSEEVFKYIPIALVACMEGLFRSLYAEIIDYGEPYSSNVEKFNNSNKKFDYSIVNAIQSKKLTVGEFISHTLSCNNISDIDNNISTLLGIKFLHELKSFETQSVFDEQRLINSSFKINADEILRSVVTVFELRHIFCHEFGTKVVVNEDSIQELFSNTKIFLENTTDFIQSKLYPNAPETQTDMNIHAYNEFDEIDTKFESYISRLRNQDFTDFLDFDKELFDESILKWKKYRESEATYKSSVVEGGSMQAMIYAMSMSTTTLRKIKELEEDYPELF
ncbi:lysozyme inhibitor LprI family protein [Psychrobacter glacincola]|uniref:lysozyme inhibitor LprI family protein n=1 Tax=Psychrobacter glacincola TaxID=56810 RepID=UPI003BB4AD65